MKEVDKQTLTSSKNIIYQLPYNGSLAVHFSTSWANDLVLNTLDNNLPNNPNPTRYTWLSAFNLRYQWKGLTATGTLVHTLIAEDVKSGNRPDNRSRFSPTLSFIYRPWRSTPSFCD